MHSFLKNLTLRNINFLFLVGVILWFLSKLPYFNLIFSPFIIFILLYLLVIILFKLSSKINIFLGIASILASFPWLLVGNRVGAENFGIFAFLSVLVGFLQEAWKLRKES